MDLFNSVICSLLLLLSVRNSFQLCRSTIAITTCQNEALQSGKSLKIPDYKSYLVIEQSNIGKIPNGAFKMVTNIQRLQLNGNKIHQLDAGAFEGLQQLQELTLYDNKLEAVPENVFQNCRNIKLLDLGMNNIQQLDNAGLKYLDSLEELNLAFNKLKTVPGDIKHLKSLKILKLYNNQIQKLHDDQFGALNKLEILNLQDNILSQISDNAFRGLNNLKELNLVNNYLKSLNADNIAKNLPSLTTIKLNINSFQCRTLANIVSIFANRNIDVPRGFSLKTENVNGMACQKL